MDSFCCLPARIADSLDVGTSPRGIYYRIPRTTRITIKKNENKNEKNPKELLVKDIEMAQFGNLASLPAETGSSNVTYKATLDPITGMLLKVAITSESASTEMCKNIIDPVGEYMKSRKDNQDELKQLTREDEILKAKVSINESKKTLGLTP